MLLAEPHFGPDALDWFNAAASSVAVVDAAARGEARSAFVELVASELPRLAANAMAMAARERGPSASVELVETALASVAFAADVVRATSPERAVRAAVLAITNAEATVPGIAKLAELDATVGEDELWPMGEPPGWSDAWAKLEVAELSGLIR